MADTALLSSEITVAPIDTATVAADLSTTSTQSAAVVRKIGPFEFNVTAKESHHDDVTITSHPVEKGAQTSDHIFRNPAQLTVQVGETAASYASGGILTLSDLYGSILTTQASGTLIEVQTGKRLYENMAIKSVATETDQTTENALMITMQLQEIILVETLTTTMPAAAVRANPAATTSVTKTGTKSVKKYSGATPWGIQDATAW